jgi:hypothetical protein
MSCALLMLALACAQPEATFADVLINKPFDELLLANPLLMSEEGAKLLKRPDGSVLVIGIASTPVRDGSPRDRKRAEVVCKTRALANIVSEKQGVVVAHTEKTESHQQVVIDNDGKKKTKSMNEYLSFTSSKMAGLTPGFQIIGRWKSADRKVYYYAVGGILNAQGEPVHDKPAAK